MSMSHSHRPILQERRNSLLDETILSPGDVKINVQGAFIVDQLPSPTPDDGAQHDSRDIRLPNHKNVVSHVALDIGGSLAKLVYFSREPDSMEVCIFPSINMYCVECRAMSQSLRSFVPTYSPDEYAEKER